MRKLLTTFFITTLVLFLLPLCVNAEDNGGYVQIEEPEIFNSKDEAFDHCMARIRDDISNFRNYNESTGEQNADYTYRFRSDRAYTAREIGENWYTETGYIPSKNNREKVIAIYKDTGKPMEDGFLEEISTYCTIQVRNVKRENGITQFTVHLTYEAGVTKEEFDRFKSKVDNAFEEMQLDGKSDFEKYYQIHTWKNQNIKYNINAEKGAWAFYSILDGQGVCSGMCNALVYMFRRAGLPAYKVGGDIGDEGHAVVVVKIDGKFYFVEATSEPALRGLDFSVYAINLADRYKPLLNSLPFDRDYYGTPDCKYGLHAYKQMNEETPKCSENTTVFLKCKYCGKETSAPGLYGRFHNSTPVNDYIQHTALKEEKINDVDCENDGVTKRYCEDCGQYEFIYTPATGHDYQAEIIQEANICGKNEITKYTCKNCGNSYEKTTKYNSHTLHSYDDGTVIKNPTLEEPGIREYHCKYCTHTYQQEIPKITPSESDWYGDDSAETQFWKWTKTDDGYTATLTRVYKKDNNITQTIDADVTVNRVEPTCQKTGLITYTASAGFPGHDTLTQEKKETLSIDQTKHVWDNDSITYEWAEDYSTCTAKRKCRYDDNTDSVSLTVSHEEKGLENGDTVMEHSASGAFPDGTEVSDTKAEKVERVYTYSNEIEYRWDGDKCKAVRHAIEDPAHTQAIPLTVTKEEEPHYCDVEGTATYTATGSFKDGLQAHDTKTVTVPVRHHLWEEVEEKPTCVKDGYLKSVCQRCGKETSKVLPATGHKWKSEETIDKEATCKEEGIKSIHCKKCNERKDITSIPKTNHSYVETITRESTCTEKGLATYTCSVCGDSYEEELPCNSRHVHTEVVNWKNATCTEAGYSGDTICSDCKATIKNGQTISATGHSFGAWETIQSATYDKEGKEQKVCKYNASHKETRSIPRLQKPTSSVKNPSTTTKVNKPQTKTTPTSSKPKTPAKPTTQAKPATKPTTPAKKDNPKVVPNIPQVKTEPITISKTPSSVKVKVKKNKATITWKKLKRKKKKDKALYKKIKGIQIQYSADKTFAQNVHNKGVGRSKAKTKLTLQRKNIYYVRIRYVGYNGFSNWSKVKRLRTK